jgi:hypothetical protein
MPETNLTKHLLKGEKIIWSGRPGQGLIFTGQDWLMIPFSFMWGGFAVFWETSVLAQPHAPFIMKLWGIPFMLIGAYFIAGRFVLDAWVRRGLQYVVTNNRVLISRPGPFPKLTSVSLNQLPSANLTEQANGHGTIRFGEASSVFGRSSNFFASWTPSLDPTPQFIAIEDARGAFEQIQRAIQSSERADR